MQRGVGCQHGGNLIYPSNFLALQQIAPVTIKGEMTGTLQGIANLQMNRVIPKIEQCMNLHLVSLKDF